MYRMPALCGSFAIAVLLLPPVPRAFAGSRIEALQAAFDLLGRGRGVSDELARGVADLHRAAALRAALPDKLDRMASFLRQWNPSQEDDAVAAMFVHLWERRNDPSFLDGIADWDPKIMAKKALELAGNRLGRARPNTLDQAGLAAEAALATRAAREHQKASWAKAALEAIDEILGEKSLSPEDAAVLLAASVNNRARDASQAIKGGEAEATLNWLPSRLFEARSVPARSQELVIAAQGSKKEALKLRVRASMIRQTVVSRYADRQGRIKCVLAFAVVGIGGSGYAAGDSPELCDIVYSELDAEMAASRIRELEKLRGVEK